MTNPTAERGGAEVYSTTRRAFHLTIIYMLGAIMTLAMAIPTVIYLLVPPRTRKRSSWIDAGDISQLKPGEPIELSFQQNSIDGWKVESVKKTAWVVKEADNQVVAFGPQCTHLACAYHWEAAENKFVCPCHGSEFSLEGKVLAGPAPRPLDRYVTKIESNRLQLGELKQTQA
jgi:menaquinol-cytochrome c reductase iron-sulfur subunit